MLKYEFIKNALFAILIITPLFGTIGTVIVNNKMAFFSDALGHSALTGIAIGAILRSNQSYHFHGNLWCHFCAATE